MTIMDVGDASTQLTSLIERVAAGEEVRITTGGGPTVRLALADAGHEAPRPAARTPAPAGESSSSPPSRRELEGIFQGHPWLGIDLDAPLDEEVARAFGMLDE